MGRRKIKKGEGEGGVGRGGGKGGGGEGGGVKVGVSGYRRRKLGREMLKMLMNTREGARGAECISGSMIMR